MALHSATPPPGNPTNCLVLLAAMRADMPLAERVANALRRRCGRQARILVRSEWTTATDCDAVVTSASANTLDPIVASVMRALTRKARSHAPRPNRRLVLVHPEPDSTHYALALRAGIDEVIAWPDELHHWCSEAAAPAQDALDAVADFDCDAPELALLGGSEAMRPVRRQISRIAAFDSNVLLVGESGSGKERVACALHRLSRRRDRPLIVLNCAALPENLIESELFGYERGAFTAAHAAYPGKFALADGGTLFLDEIGDMPSAAQAKILRVIEGHEYYRLGATRPTRSDVRLIAATHRDLDRLCAQGDFRHDLYFRLNVARIDLPPLRSRPTDVLLLAERFVAEFRATMRRPNIALGAAVRTALRAYAWPGNVRELRNAIESALIHAEGLEIGLHDLPAHIVRWVERQACAPDERTRLVSSLHHTHWNKSAAARELNWSRMKLYRKLRLYKLESKLGDS